MFSRQGIMQIITAPTETYFFVYFDVLNEKSLMETEK